MDLLPLYQSLLRENAVSDKIWYHGSSKPVKKFLYSLVGKLTDKIHDNHGHGIYFIDDIDQAKSYGSVIMKVRIDDDADILIDKITSQQLLKIFNQLKKENVTLHPDDEQWWNNPTYGEYSILNDVEEFYYLPLRWYKDTYKSKEDLSGLFLRSGIDGMHVINDMNDNILVVFNEDIITIQ